MLSSYANDDIEMADADDDEEDEDLVEGTLGSMYN